MLQVFHLQLEKMISLMEDSELLGEAEQPIPPLAVAAGFLSVRELFEFARSERHMQVSVSLYQQITNKTVGVCFL